MKKHEVLAKIREIGIIPSARLFSAEDALFAAEAVSSGGIPVIEITMTVPGALDVIASLTRAQPAMIVGAGTVMDIETAHKCVDAGAAFLTSPGLDLTIVEFARSQDVAVFPGAATPTEIVTAWKAGADLVKVYPCSAFGGASYLKALKAPFPHIPFMAAGGVNQQNVAEFILAGAVAVGIGSHLIHPNAITKRQREWIHELSHRYLNLVRAAHEGSHRPPVGAGD